jgi:hypothetical protein
MKELSAVREPWLCADCALNGAPSLLQSDDAESTRSARTQEIDAHLRALNIQKARAVPLPLPPCLLLGMWIGTQL